jgi:DNA-binding MarR family transcriptional regulator
MTGGGASRLDLAAFTPYRIVVLGRAMSEALGAAYAGEGLTIPEWRVLAVVSQAPSMAARDVVARTPMDKMAVSRAVASLEEKELIGRGPTADRRVSMLKLSAKGRQVYDRVAAIALSYERALMSSLSEAERWSFSSILDRLEKAIGVAAEEESASQAAE